MIGVRVGCDQQVDPAHTECPEIVHDIIAMVHVPGIDEDGFIADEDQGRIPLPDIEKIYPEVAVYRLV